MKPDGEIDYLVKLEGYSGHHVMIADPKDLRLKECKANASTN